jgi:hypothetical protein
MRRINNLCVVCGVSGLLVGVMREINNPYVFYGVAGLLVAYLLYMMIRRRKGERPGSAVREPEL